MPTETTPDAVLNGIITCNQCNARMALKQDETSNHPYFTCTHGWRIRGNTATARIHRKERPTLVTRGTP